MARLAEVPDIQLTTGGRVGSLAIGTHGITASVETDDETVEVEGSLLVGADGVWSSVRALVDSTRGTAPPRSRFSGELAWRTTVAVDSAAGKPLPRSARPTV